MRVIRSLAEVPAIPASVVTIGNFDGLHRGHSAILSEVRERATRSDAWSVAITFEPHPLEKIAPQRAPTPISTARQRVSLIESTGIDLLLVQCFDEAFSCLTPVQFIKTYLVGALKTQTLCVGHNFRFGYEHRGNIETLNEWADQFDVVEIPSVRRGKSMVSSTRIRGLLEDGNVSAARRLLGRCYPIEGRIVAGAGRGRTSTVPTLNLAPDNRLMPRDGVYLTRASIDGGGHLDALTNVGVRPTFQQSEGHSDRTVETYLLDPPETAHPETLEIRFLRRLRDERRFPDAAALRRQILTDIDAAARYFRRLSATCSPSHVS